MVTQVLRHGVAVGCFAFLFSDLDFLCFSLSSRWSSAKKGFNRDLLEHLAFTFFSILDPRTLESNLSVEFYNR